MSARRFRIDTFAKAFGDAAAVQRRHSAFNQIIYAIVVSCPRIVTALFVLWMASTCAGHPPRVAPGAKQEPVTATWKKHVIAKDTFAWTALAADFTGDKRVDVISSDRFGKRTILHVAPDWREIPLHEGAVAMHSATFDVDGDGDADYVGGQYMPGLMFWLERPTDPLNEPWPYREIDSLAAGGVHGIHGLTVADVDADGRVELVSNSNQPDGPLSDSVVYYRVPANPRHSGLWPRVMVAAGDATGFNHYMGVGDLDGDGLPEIATGAKLGNYFAYWSRKGDPTLPWQKHLLPGLHPGATNIVMADMNGDGGPDLVASRGHGKGVLWFEGPTFAKTHSLDEFLEGPHALAVGDIDGDGDVDVAAATTTSATATWFRNEGRGHFSRHDLASAQSAYDLRLVDMDGDSDLDMLLAGQESRNVVWLENPLRR